MIRVHFTDPKEWLAELRAVLVTGWRPVVRVTVKRVRAHPATHETADAVVAGFVQPEDDILYSLEARRGTPEAAELAHTLIAEIGDDGGLGLTVRPGYYRLD